MGLIGADTVVVIVVVVVVRDESNWKNSDDIKLIEGIYRIVLIN